MGLCLTIPVSMIIEVIGGGKQFGLPYLLGTGGVWAGFVAVSCYDHLLTQ